MYRFKCKNCNHGEKVTISPDSSISTDLYGERRLVTKYYIDCQIESEVDSILTNMNFNFLIAFADDSDDSLVDNNKEHYFYTFTDNFLDCHKIKDYYTFDNIDELIEFWKEMSKKPLGMWYYCVHNKNNTIKTFCSGAVDPADLEEIIIPYKNSL